MLKICLIAAFPPSRGPLNEYSFSIAREIRKHHDVELVILADELDGSQATATQGSTLSDAHQAELANMSVIRCWKFGSIVNPVRILNTIRQQKPDVVWFNLVFSSFGTPDSPMAAFAGLSIPALTRAAGFYTHITLHHIIEHVDIASTGVRREKLYRMGTDVATRALLKAHSVSVLLSAYRRTLMTKYDAQNILVGTHGILSAIPAAPDLTKRGDPTSCILAFGHWGTYKRLEKLMEAFPTVLAAIPNARLIIAGTNHPSALGYLESLEAAQPPDAPIEFLGYVAQKDVPDLFRKSSLLVMPYNSSTGSSGPAHLACEYGVPIVCADIPDFRCMAADDDMAIDFFKIGDATDLAAKLIHVLQSPTLQRQMSEHNYEAGVQMTMATVANNYLRWFELHKFKRSITGESVLTRSKRRILQWWSSRPNKSEGVWNLDSDLLPKNLPGYVRFEEVGTSNIEISSIGRKNLP